jgi:hypothetical protein
MKLATPEKGELMKVDGVEPYQDGIMIRGRIMGTMQVKAVLRPSQLREGIKMLSPRLIFTLIAMVFRRDRE